MAIIDDIDRTKLPKHVAIIMDGNGRWAKQKGKNRVFGHQQGARSVKEVVKIAGELGIKYLTLYAFSTENWNRPKLEVEALMALLVSSINTETKELIENNVKLLSIGHHHILPQKVNKKLQQAIGQTQHCTGLNLILALSYSSKWEIMEAIRKIANKIVNQEIKPDEINEQLMDNCLTTAGIPDPELMIRTSGEYRISNFLLWQLAYSELYFTQTLWPDFGRNEFIEALLDYQKRERRFGKTSDQITNK
jgi:undecaprenyl diphosphate synthase